MHHPDATENDLYGEALSAFVKRLDAGPPYDRRTNEVLRALRSPIVVAAGKEERHLIIQALLGFGPLGRPAGHA
jgi:hypothetical protein